MRNEVSHVFAHTVIQAGGNVEFHAQQAVVAPPRRPAQVPPSTPWWVDRVRSLNEWRALLGSTEWAGVSVSVLSGMRGVGKSALASRMAEEAGDRFPGGQIYVNLADWRDHRGRVDVSGALRACLRSLGIMDAHLPPSLPELRNDFRSMTATAAVLVVLDEVTEPAQVDPFVPAARGSIVLAVSSGTLRELVVEGARLVRVEPLDAPSAVGLLVARCGQRVLGEERAAAEQLIEWCGRLPLALDVIAGRLALHPEEGLRDLVGELTDESRRLDGFSSGRNDALPAALTLVYRDLPPDCRRLFRGLGYFPGPEFDAHIAAAVLGDAPPQSARRVLRTLDEANLITAVASGRYRLHELVRLFAQARAAESAEDERRGVARRLIEYFTVRAACADRAIMGDRLRVTSHERLLAGVPDPFDGEDGKRAALEWLRTQRANALAVLRQAVDHELWTPAWQLAESLTALYLNERYVRDWITTAELGIEAAVRGEDKEAEARLRCLYSRPLLDEGRVEQARAELRIAVARAAETDNVLLRASAAEFLGRAWEREDTARAIELFAEAARLSEEADAPRGVALALYFTGCAESIRERPEAAVGYLTHALGRFMDRETRSYDRRMAGRSLVALGEAQRARGRPDEATARLVEGARLLQKTGATHYELPARRLLVEIAEADGDLDAQRRHLERVVAILTAGGSPEAAVARARLDTLSQAP
ncbi:ATP-binding protein [Streptomyces hainanensis]|uniref:NB-ARC domain-containing protein n=1 Tax=Streptomyces hainanensis TaxID=402648 RepID=A0A4R4TB28_9ACTN|nr:NB-ARC domain-containing protein [Streptomyces hainanensis]TDC74531.1 hypothetical protein E1283_15375 [Streptomyces hainanensis]